MEQPIPPNPDTMTDEEFDKWLEAEFIWEAEEMERALFPDGIPEDTSTPEDLFIYKKMYILGNAVLFLLFAGVKGHFLFICRYCILYMRINLKRKEHAGGQAEPDQWASVV